MTATTAITTVTDMTAITAIPSVLRIDDHRFPGAKSVEQAAQAACTTGGPRTGRTCRATRPAL